MARVIRHPAYICACGVLVLVYGMVLGKALRCWAGSATLESAIVVARQQVQRLEPSLNENDVEVEASDQNSSWPQVARDPSLATRLRDNAYWTISIIRKPVPGIATNDTGWTVFVDKNTGKVLGHFRHGD